MYGSETNLRGVHSPMVLEYVDSIWPLTVNRVSSCQSCVANIGCLSTFDNIQIFQFSPVNGVDGSRGKGRHGVSVGLLSTLYVHPMSLSLLRDYCRVRLLNALLECGVPGRRD